jgi:hypothetical protein
MKWWRKSHPKFKGGKNLNKIETLYLDSLTFTID